MMDRSESIACLLDCDELDICRSTDSGDDSGSSGYDSATESSDMAFGSEAVEQSDNTDDGSDVTRYRSTYSLCNHLKYILLMPELCDVIFLVGEKKTPVYGVKAILSTRSRVFYNLILKTQRQREAMVSTKSKKKPSKQTTLDSRHLPIEVNKYKAEDFRRIIQFVHCGKVDIDVGNVIGLYCGASQFDLPDLEMACWDYIQHMLSTIPRSITRLGHEIEDYSHHRSSTKLWTKVTEYASSLADDISSCCSAGKETVLR